MSVFFPQQQIPLVNFSITFHRLSLSIVEAKMNVDILFVRSFSDPPANQYKKKKKKISIPRKASIEPRKRIRNIKFKNNHEVKTNYQ